MEEGSLTLRPIEGPELESGDAPLSFSPRGTATLGRGRDCGVCLPDATVSRRHASLVCRGSTWFVRDLESRHGIYLNAVRLAPNDPHPLANGDLLRIGPWTFRVGLGGAAESTGRLHPTMAEDAAALRVSHVAARELAEHRLHLILDAAARINDAETTEALTEAVVDSVLAGTSFQRAAVLREHEQIEQVEVLFNRSRNSADDEEAEAFSFSQSLIRAAASGQTARLTSEDPTAMQLGHSIEQLGITDALCAPIFLGGAVAAYLYLDARGSQIPIQSDAADFCQAIARMCGMALEKLKRIEIEERHRRLEAELSAAREAQQLIVPKARNTVGPLHYVMRMQPGSIVAGDLFDVIALDGGRVGVVLGDVTGEGVGAAILMASTQAHLHAALRRYGDPAAALNEVNDYVCRHEPRRRFVSMWVGVFDAANGRLNYVDAGHGYWLRRRANQPPDFAPRAGGTLVGIDNALRYEPAALDLTPGERIILFSDGVVEQTNPEGEQFGVARIRAVVERSISPDDDVAGVFTAVEAHAQTSVLADDATVASIEIQAADD